MADTNPPKNIERQNSVELFDESFSTDRSFNEIVKNAFRTFLNNFILAYGIRTGISVILRAIQLARTRPSKLLSFHGLFGEQNLIVRVDAVRLGLTLGGFTGLFKLLFGILSKCKKLYPSFIVKKLDSQENFNALNAFVAGSIAGSALLFQVKLNSSYSLMKKEKDNRRTIALYLFVRLLQCIYNSAKRRGWWHFWGSHWEHGDSLLFAITSAQVMYAYVMRPDSIPSSYYKFILRTGPIQEKVLDAVKAMNRGAKIDTEGIFNYVKAVSKGRITSLSSIPELATNPPLIIPCSVLHPHNQSCVSNFGWVFSSAGKKIFPLYATITVVPMVLLRLKSFLKKPLFTLWQVAFSAARSTTFLALFVSLYQAAICMHRKSATKDHRSIYFISGLFSSLAILLERKSRRSELALYVLPRALDSWYIQLYDRKWFGSVPFGDLLLFMISTGGLMSYLLREPENMSPALGYVLNILFKKRLYL